MLGRRATLAALSVLAAGAYHVRAVGDSSSAPAVVESRSRPGRYHYAPSRRPAASLEAILDQLSPGGDAFPEEKPAREIADRLSTLGAALREGRVDAEVDALLAPEFRGGRLASSDEVSVGNSPHLGIFRPREPVDGRAAPADLDRRAFAAELRGLARGFDGIRVTEFLITGIETKGDLVRTEVRYDIVGAGGPAWRGERVGRWRMAWRAGADGAWRVVEWSALAYQRSVGAEPVFVETTDAALAGNASFRAQLVPGLDDWTGRLDGVFVAGGVGHHGVSVGDIDGDGLDDLYVSQPAGLPNRLFRNKGDGSFEDVTEAAGVGVLDSTSQALFADVDNDGDQDLILVTRNGLLLFLNDGTGRFTAVPDAFRFKRGLKGSPTSAALADYDRDGFLDIYLCTYSYFIGATEDKAATPTPYHDAQNGPPNVLLRNDGHGRFVEVTDEAGLGTHNDRFSFAASWADYDEDGWPDLLVANDFGRKNLYHNEGLKDGKVTFKEVTAEAGVEDYGAGMSATWVDYDNDGHLDIYTGNMWAASGQRVTSEPGFMPEATPELRALYRRHARGNSLFRNRGDGTFEDVTLKARAEFGRWAWSSDAIDFDNDGYEDLLVMNGMITDDGDQPNPVDYDSFFWRQVVARSPATERLGTSYDDGWRAINRLLMAEGQQAPHERKVLLRNDGHGGFDEVSGSVGLDLDQDGRSFAVFDYDRDGRPDVVLIAPRSSPQVRLFHNEFRERNAALAVRLAGTQSNRDAVGARVTVETELGVHTKVVHAGSGFISEHSKELLFGLGKSRRVVKVEVRWPNGLSQTFTDVPIDRRVSIVEGSEAVRAEPFKERGERPAAAPAAAPTSEAHRPGTWLYRPFPAPDFSLRDTRGVDRSLASLRGKPALLLFWSPDAPPSVAALQGLARTSKALTAAGAQPLALAVGADESRVRAAIQDPALPLAVATEEVAGVYSVVSRFLFDHREDLRLPTLLLVDGRGEIEKIYRDDVDMDEVLGDVPRIEASPADRLARAVPFPGTFRTPPGERNYFQYSLDLAEQGYDAAALAGFERAAKQDPISITFYNLGTLYLKAAQNAKARTAFERSLELKPDYAEANNSLGALLAQGGEVPAAIERFRAALKARPAFADALNNLGYALFQTGRPEEAEALYHKALAAQPGFPEALNNLGILFGKEGDLDRAEPYFMQAVEARPTYGEAANNLALVKNARGDVSGAVTVLQRLLQNNPAFEAAYVTLARVYLGAGRGREGIQVLELLLQRNPSNAQALEILRQVRGRP